MNGAWKLKWYGVLFAVFFGIYLLLPTILGTENKREALEAANEPIPWAYHLLPRHGLKLGLDLQGGIYVELAVDIDGALKRRTDVLGNELMRFMDEKKAPPTRVSQVAIGELEIHLKEDAHVQVLEEIRAKYRDYRQAFTIQRGDAAKPANGAAITSADAPATPAETPSPETSAAPASAGNDVVVRVVMTKPYLQNLRESIVAQATESVRNRINRYGVGEPDIRRQGNNRIAIELPGLKDPDRALDLIKRTGQLELRLVHDVASEQALAAQENDLRAKVAQARKDNNIPEDDYSAATVAKLNDLLKKNFPPDTELVFELNRSGAKKGVTSAIPFLVDAKAQVTGDMLEDARAQMVDTGPQVAFTFNATGAKIFGELTKANIKHYLAIMLDGNVMSHPYIKSAITGGSGVIEMGGSDDLTAQNRDAHDLTLVLQEGALPATLTEATKTVVGPTLGADLIKQGVWATAAATLAVIIFMILYYKLSGILADLAVLLNLTLILAILALFDATLTLPGIAGIVLTVGMAVDANVLINERIREELRAGRGVKQAVLLGYAHAKRAIIDSNVTTLIAGIFLYYFGTGPVKGFAVTLCVGIATTLFTAVVMTETVYEYLFATRKVERLSI